MISKVQALAIETAANAGLCCMWANDAYRYHLMPLDSDPTKAVLKLVDPSDVWMMFTVMEIWTECDELHISTADGFKLVLPIEDEEGEDE